MRRSPLLPLLALALTSVSVLGTFARAQSSAPSAAASAADKPDFKQEELDQMLAPLALYPDSLLTQILMASTYPLEIVEADRWVKANPSLKGDAAAKALEEQDWDPSVKSLVNFPDVLTMLSEKLDWTQKIGDAFIGQQAQVMSTVQALRAKAKDAGKLESTSQQTVKVEQQGSTQIIQIEPADPQVIYVPSYNPTVVYGAWPYPSYPPYPYYPPGYVASNVLSFGVGVACGVAWGYAWGHCDWNHSNIDININQNNQFNQFINHNKYQNIGGQTHWQHDPAHRQGVGYRNQAATQRFGGATQRQATQARDSFRGRAESGRSAISHGDADAFKGHGAVGQGGAGQRHDAGASSGRSGAFSGSGESGRSTREASDRGRSSRSASSGSGTSRRSAPSRPSTGGSGARGGGGMHGGGGGGFHGGGFHGRR